VTAAELLAECRVRNVILQAHGDRLDIDGPEHELTPDLLALLRTRKPELLQILRTAAAAVAAAPAAEGLPPPWRLPRWPAPVPPEIIAAPIPACDSCGRHAVIPGQPGRAAGLCFPCWIIISQKDRNP